VLADRGLRWYVFGAQAVVAYGRPRLTADLDVTVELEPALAGGLRAALTREGFASRVEEASEFVRRTRVLPLLHEASGTPVDVILAGPGLEIEFMARARPVDLGGLMVPLISPEDLLVTKILAGRPKDLEDVGGVLAEQGGRLDVGRVRSVLGLLEQALDRRDLLPELEAALREADCTG
jgi:hypothetical protein